MTEWVCGGQPPLRFSPESTVFIHPKDMLSRSPLFTACALLFDKTISFSPIPPFKTYEDTLAHIVAVSRQYGENPMRPLDPCYLVFGESFSITKMLPSPLPPRPPDADSPVGNNWRGGWDGSKLFELFTQMHAKILKIIIATSPCSLFPRWDTAFLWRGSSRAIR